MVGVKIVIKEKKERKGERSKEGRRERRKDEKIRANEVGEIKY